jgi:hypothetical protein
VLGAGAAVEVQDLRLNGATSRLTARMGYLARLDEIGPIRLVRDEQWLTLRLGEPRQPGAATVPVPDRVAARTSTPFMSGSGSTRRLVGAGSRPQASGYPGGPCTARA